MQMILRKLLETQLEMQKFYPDLELITLGELKAIDEIWDDEEDFIVQTKAARAIEAGLTAVICIGETLEEREAGKALDVVTDQVRGSVPVIATAENCVIAYEPIWAIGTGKVPTTADVAEVHAAIRAELAAILGSEIAEGMRILYGGSVKPSNAKELLAVDNVDGALIGGASLKADDFWAIAETQM